MKNTTIKNIAKTVIATALVVIVLVITAPTVAHSQTKQSKPKQKPVNVDSIEANKPHIYTKNPKFTFWSFQAHLFTADDGHDYLVYTDAKTFASMLHSEGCKLCAMNKAKETTTAPPREGNVIKE